MVSGANHHSHYRVVGGPLDRTIASVKKRATTYCEIDPDDRFRRQFCYVLAASPDGRQVFVPEEDEHLLDALRGSSGESGDPTFGR